MSGKERSAMETIVGTIYWTVAMSIYKKLYANTHMYAHLRTYRVKPVYKMMWIRYTVPF